VVFDGKVNILGVVKSKNLPTVFKKSGKTKKLDPRINGNFYAKPVFKKS